MNTFNSKLFSAFLVLLASAFSAHSVSANPDIDYAKRCSECHGAKPGPESALQPINLDNFANTDELKDFINDYMPLGSATSCEDSCAEGFAKLLEVIVARPDFPPEARVNITAGPTNGKGEAPLALTFDGSSSTDNEGIVSYDWSFGDGTSATGVTASHTYITPGLYTATLTATDTDGLTGSHLFNIQVRTVGAKVVADLRNTTQTEGEVPLHTQFSGLGSYCADGPCTHIWNPGDGSGDFEGHSSMFNNYDYLTPGNYTAVLTVTDINGISDSVEVEINTYPSESFYSYVQSCKSALDFDDDDIPATMNCADGDLFAGGGGGVINDYVGYETITDKVDLVFACRWLSDAGFARQPPFVQAASIEMIMHNRENGNTCFFRAHEEDEIAPSTLISPTVAANAAPGTPESKYWVPPIDLARELPCTDCHVAGPYIATPRIAPFLTKYGLLNNGHDTFGLVRDADNPDVIHGNYHIVGDTFQVLRDMAVDFNVPSELTCANGCHSIGYRSTQGDIDEGTTTFNLLPGLLSVIFHADDVVIADASVHDQSVMPANNPYIGNAEDNAYSWINRDTPLSSWNDSDVETFSAAKAEYENLLNYCGSPGYMYAHEVGSDREFRTEEMPQNVRTFNAQDGLVCVNTDTEEGLCYDYFIEYECEDSFGDVYWTEENNWDTPAGNWNGAGDYETRNDHIYVCNSGDATTGIKASYVHPSNGWTYSLFGPVDRLEKFDRNGLICNNTDQDDGQCANYVVKFGACTDVPPTSNVQIESVASGYLLTAAGSGNDADVRVQPFNGGWDTQEWELVPVAGSSAVRIRNTAENRYLNAQNQSNYADAVLYDYQDGWGSQQWIIETIPASSEVFFKNVWSGYYLTTKNSGNFSDMKVQQYNPGWPTQRWRIQP